MKSYKDQFKVDFATHLDLSRSLSRIKTAANIEFVAQTIERFVLKTWIRVAILIMMSLATGFSGFVMGHIVAQKAIDEHPAIIYIYADLIINPFDQPLWYSVNPHVFIATVTAAGRVDNTPETGMQLRIPTSYFSVEVLHSFKGEASGAELIAYRGGFDTEQNLVLYYGDSGLPVVGSTYMFFAFGPVVSGEYDFGSFVVETGYAKVLLEEYQVSLPWSEQSSDLQAILSGYLSE